MRNHPAFFIIIQSTRCYYLRSERGKIGWVIEEGVSYIGASEGSELIGFQGKKKGLTSSSQTFL